MNVSFFFKNRHSVLLTLSFILLNFSNNSERYTAGCKKHAAIFALHSKDIANFANAKKNPDYYG